MYSSHYSIIKFISFELIYYIINLGDVYPLWVLANLYLNF